MPTSHSRGRLALAVGAAPAGLLLLLVLLVVLLAGGAAQLQQQCGTGAAPLPGGFSGPGSLGGVAGTGLTAAQVDAVRSGSTYAGTRVAPGRYESTAYGPPWGGINGPGEAMSGGLILGGGAPRWYAIAVDPAAINHGTLVYAWPNPFGWKGPFLAADTGGAIIGRHIDFYDWRGRSTQLAWHRDIQISDRPIRPGGPDTTTTPLSAGGCATGAVAGPVDFRSSQRLSGPRRYRAIPPELVSPGFPVEAVDERIWPDVVFILRHYDLRLTAGREAGHASHGAGTAIDVVPAGDNGGQAVWDRSAGRLAADLGWTRACGANGLATRFGGSCRLREPIRFVGYDGYPSHGSPRTCGGGCPAHIHVSWVDSYSPGASPGLVTPPSWVEAFAARTPGRAA